MEPRKPGHGKPFVSSALFLATTSCTFPTLFQHQSVFGPSCTVLSVFLPPQFGTHSLLATCWSRSTYTGHGYYWTDDCLLTGKPSRYVASYLGQLSLPSLQGRLIEYQPVWLWLGGTRSLVSGGG